MALGRNPTELENASLGAASKSVWRPVNMIYSALPKVPRQLIESKEDMRSLGLGAPRSIQEPAEPVKSLFRQPECRCALSRHYFLQS